MEQNEKYIGVFDSGIGGLTVVKSIVRSMPNENIIYFGDTAHVPYGTRSKEQITEYVLKDVKFLSIFDIKAVVIACNTADSIAREKVEQLYPLPVFGVVHPASRKAALSTVNNKIGIIATNATVNSGAYEKAICAINPDAEVFSVACPLLVPLVENGRWRSDDIVVRTVLEEYLAKIRDFGVDTLILGCTHYPLLTEVIGDVMGPEVTLINTGAEAAWELKRTLTAADALAENAEGKTMLYASDRPSDFGELAARFLRQDVPQVLSVDIDSY